MRDEFVKADGLTMHNNSNDIAIEISNLTVVLAQIGYNINYLHGLHFSA
jgi:hypothetical protein